MAGFAAPGRDVTSNISEMLNEKWVKIGKSVTRTVTFKVVSGAWENGSKNSISKKITGFEDETKLLAGDIPAVGSKPDPGYTDPGYKEGSWDVTPKAGTLITADTTFTYTYAKEDAPASGTQQLQTPEEQITINKKPTLKKPKPKKNKATITWNKLKRKTKAQKKIWKQIKQIEVEWSTDPSFPKELTNKKNHRKAENENEHHRFKSKNYLLRQGSLLRRWL